MHRSFVACAIVAGSFAPLVAQCSTTWQPIAGADSGILALARFPNGDIAAGGHFTSIGGTPANYVARWNGTNWTPLGSGTSYTVEALTTLPDGSLIAGGWFQMAGGSPAASVAKWDGANWAAMGTGFPYDLIWALTKLPNGDVIAGGRITTTSPTTIQGVARWDGSTWTPVGSFGLPGDVYALATLSNGDLVAGGSFNQGFTLGGLARWNGFFWGPAPGFASTNGLVFALAPLPNGDLIVGGNFTDVGVASANNIARFHAQSNTWSALGTGTNGRVHAVLVLPDGDLLVGGDFTTAGGQTANNIARWDGTSWSAFGVGTDVTVHALVAQPDDSVLVGGLFQSAGGQPATGLAKLASTCPATASEIPTPCVGPAGAMTSRAAQLPWVGSTCQLRAGPFASSAFGVSVLGFSSPQTSLATIHATALPNCNLLASGDALLLVLPTAGVGTYQFAIPNGGAFVGLQLFHQFLQFDVSGQGHIASLSGSNGLRLTIGMF